MHTLNSFCNCLQVNSISLAARELDVTLREAAVADREMRAAQTKQDTYSFCRKAEEEKQVALQRVAQLTAALSAIKDQHAEVSHLSSSRLNVHSHV